MTEVKAVPAPHSMSVYDCIVAVSHDIAQEGIAKTRKNAQQGYQFRGIDDVLNALAPLLAKHRLVILPRVLSRDVTERSTKTGGMLFYVTVECEFDFVSAADGSKHTVKTYGEAMDSADKATNKAQSAAYKYAAFQTFCIPTEGDNDADAVTHEPIRTPVHQDAPDLGVDLPHSTVLVTRVDVGQTKNPKVQRYTLSLAGGPEWPANQTSCTTINTKMANLAAKACQDKQPVFIVVEKNQYGFDLKAIELAKDMAATKFQDDTEPVDLDSIPF